MGIYGEARYDRNTLTMVNLDIEDFKAIRYDKQKNGYPYAEKVFEYEGDLLDYILDQKFDTKLGLEVYQRVRLSFSSHFNLYLLFLSHYMPASLPAL